LATVLLAKDTHENLVSSFSTLSIIAVSLFIVSFSICVFSVRKIPIHQASKVNTSNLKSVVQILKHRPVAIVFLLTPINSFCIPLVGAGLVYLGTRYSNLEYSGIGILNALATAQIISLFVWIRHDKINTKYF
jgi:CBS domain containing-hemolysin-like protein